MDGRSQKIDLFCSGNDMMPIYYNDYIDRYVALYSKPLSRDAVLRTAPRPEGPWSTALQVFKARAPDSDNSWIYDALAHPEYGGWIVLLSVFLPQPPRRLYLIL